MILARCILSFAGYGPCDKKAFLTARPAHGKLWEQDWQTNNNIKNSVIILKPANLKTKEGLNDKSLSIGLNMNF